MEEETVVRKQALMPNSTPLPLSIRRRDSHLTTKVKPKIRIIHVFAPEIIETDVANFRELVQRLTGRPTNSDHHPTSGKRNIQKVPGKSVEDTGSVTSDLHSKPLTITRKMEALNNLIDNTPSHGDYFSGLSDIECFIHDIGELPLLPMDPSYQIHSSSEESQLT